MLSLIAAMMALAPGQWNLDARVNTLLDESGSPAALVAVISDEGYEIAVAGVRAHGSEAPVTQDDLWHLGSVTKPVTATLAARLVEQGVISWDARVGDVLAGLDLDIHPDLARADLTALLSHRSGMRANAGLLTSVRLAGADGDRDAAADRRVYAREVLRRPGGAPGEFVYSNAGYVVAALMMETAAGEAYEALMAREVFDPLGLGSAGWGPPGQPGRMDQPRGHGPGLFGMGVRSHEPGADADNPPALNPAGRIHMNARDILTFLDLHRRGAAGAATDYLQAGSFARLHAPQGEYALGWGVSEDGRLSHAGSNTLWLVQAVIDPQAGWAGVAGVNDGRLDQVSGPVRAALADD
ncbi:serine hydrolase domain-containing protein [Alkalicaulis satelles]|nr:serine hydrolase domain-containing protein [Alkalicaulis satelles]